MEEAEILITDNSSIVFEYVLILKDQLFIDYKEKVHNIKSNEISIQTIEDKFKSFGNVLNISNLEKLYNLCEDLSLNSNVSNEAVKSFSKKYLSNLGNSAAYAANF